MFTIRGNEKRDSALIRPDACDHVKRPNVILVRHGIALWIGQFTIGDGERLRHVLMPSPASPRLNVFNNLFARFRFGLAGRRKLAEKPLDAGDLASTDKTEPQLAPVSDRAERAAGRHTLVECNTTLDYNPFSLTSLPVVIRNNIFIIPYKQGTIGTQLQIVRRNLQQRQQL